MPTNEFDQLLKSAPEPEAPTNEFDSLLGDERSQKMQAVGAAAYAMRNIDPERAARAAKMAREIGVSEDIIQSNFEQAQADYSVAKLNPSDLMTRAPKFTDFLASNPLYTPVVKDDVETFEKIEATAGSHSYARDMFGAIGSGALNMLSGLAKLPALSTNYIPGPEALQGDYDFKQMQAEANAREVPDFLYNNKLTQALDERAKALAPEDLNVDVVGAVRGGDYGKATRALSLQIASNIPQLGMIAATRGAGLPLMFAGSAGGKMAQNLEAGVDPETARVSALTNAAIETGIESLGGIGQADVFKTSIKQIAKEIGPRGALDLLKASTKEVLKTGGEEGLEEAVTSVAQDLLDYGLDINPDAKKGMASRAVNSFLVGAGAGVAMGTTHKAFEALPRLQSEYQKNFNTERAKEGYQAIGEILDQSKAFKRDPEGFAPVLAAQVKDTPMEKAYMPVSALDALFQTKGVSPTEAARALGLLDEYRSASETGADMQIEFADFAVKAKQAEVYEDLIDDLKMRPEDDTPRQRQSEKQAARAELQAQERQVREADDAFEADAKVVEKNIEAQLKATGATGQEAKAQAVLWRETLKSFASRSGIKASDILSRYNPRIQNAEENTDAALAQHIFNQSANADVYAKLESILPRTGDRAVDDAAREALQADPERYKEYLATLDQLGPRELRAALMGYGSGDVYYHGTRFTEDQIKEFIASGTRKGDVFKYGKGVYVSPWSGLADQYADETGVIYPVRLKYRGDFNPADTDMAREIIEKAGFSIPKTAGLLRSTEEGLHLLEKVAKREGIGVSDLLDKSGLRVSLKDDGITVAQPNEIRSTNAAFDPRFADSPVILAQSEGAYRIADKATFKGKDGKQYSIAEVPDKAAFGLPSIEVRDETGEVVGTLKGINRDTTEYSPGVEVNEAHRRNGIATAMYDYADARGFTIPSIEAGANARTDDGAAFREARGEGGKTQFESDSFNQGDDVHRGQINFADRSNVVINLFRAKNESTFLHESAHFFLEIMGDLAATENVAQSLKDDYKTLLDFVGVESRDQIKVEHHEKIARGFEQYLREGKGPTTALRRAFASFKSWLTRIYPFAEQLNVEISPEVREVFDRMLMAENQVDNAQAELNQQPMFTDVRALVLNEEQAQKYDDAVAAVHERATAKIRKDLFDDLRMRDEAYYKEAEAKLTDEVTEELENTRDYRAIAALTGKVPADMSLMIGSADLKISKQSVIESFGIDALKALPRGTTSNADTAVHVENVAMLLNYADGQALVEALQNKPKLKDAVAARVKEQMDLQYPDRMNDPEISERAVEAVHNDERAKVIKMEAEMLRDLAPAQYKAVTERLIKRLNSKVLKEEAQATIASLLIRDLRANVYRAAEVRASKEAARAWGKGDIQAAVEAKRTEALNHELFRAATEAREYVSKETKKLRRFDKSDEDLAKTRDLDIIITARAVMAQFGLGSETKTPEEALRQMKAYDMDAYITTMRHIDAAVSEIDNPTGEFQDLKLKDFQALIEQTDALWDFAKSNRELVRKGEKFDRDTLIANAVERLQLFSKVGPAGAVTETVSKMQKLKKSVQGWVNGYRRIESLAYLLDGGDANGPVSTLVVKGVQEQQAKFFLALEENKSELDQIFEKVMDDKHEAIPAPELNHIFKNGMREVLHVMAHMGNSSNLQKLVLGGRGEGLAWGTLSEDGVLDASRVRNFISRLENEGTIQKKHWDVVEQYWALNEKNKPIAQIAYKKRFGRFFPEITAEPFQTKYGEVTGGYAPAITDPDIVNETDVNLDKELVNLQVAFMLPTTGKGFTMARVDGYNKPLLLDMGRVHSSMSKLLRFAYLEPTIAEAVRVVKDPNFQRAMNNIDPTIIDEIIIPSLDRAATQVKVKPMTGPSGRAIQSVLNAIRRNASIQFLGGNVKNATENVANALNAVARVPTKHLLMAVKNAVINPQQTSAFVIEKSDFMRTKIGKNADHIRSAFDEFNNPSKFSRVKEITSRWAMIFDMITNHLIEKAVWMGAYNDALSRGIADADASYHADSMVRQTTSDATPASVSNYESGNAVMQMVTMFSSYFNTQYNNQLTNAQLAKQLGFTTFKGSRLLLKSVFVGHFAVAAFGELVRRAWAGQNVLDADEDGEYIDDLMDYFLTAPLKYAAAYAPLGVAANHIFNQLNSEPYDDKLDLSPGLGAAANLVNLPKEISQAREGRNQGKAVQDVLMAAGLVTGLPIGVLGRPARYLLDADEGKARPSNPADFARGLVTGKPGLAARN